MTVSSNCRRRRNGPSFAIRASDLSPTCHAAALPAALVTGGEKTAPCGSCHGSDLSGSGDIPRLIGRSPSYLFRQLNDIKIGAHTGPHVDPMRPVAVLDDSEMIAIAAYLAAQRP